MRVVQQPSLGTLLPDPTQSVDFDTTRNVVIEGDNLEVLKLLQNSYYGQVKMIYIDPPYNTGNDFIYPDNYTEGLQDYLRYSGQVDANGHKRSTNTDTSGRFHSKWLNMMYPRLFLARNLLREDGVIFVSIDDGEVAHLREVMDEVFGEENFVGTIAWKKKTNGNNVGQIPPVHDYFVCHAKSVEQQSIYGFPMTAAQIEAAYSNLDSDPRGLWTTTDLSANHKGPYFEIENPTTGERFLPPSGRYWVFGNAEIKKRIADGRIIFGRNGQGRPIQKRFLSDRKSQRLLPESWWDRHGLNEDGSKELTDLLEQPKLFDHPKPSTTIKHLVNVATLPTSSDIILDFFAGSGTTGHAVMKLNAEDGGNRRYILVQLPEPVANDGPYATISEITRERLRRAGAQVREQAAKDGKDISALDTGFQAYSLAESNFRQWQGDPAAPQFHDGQPGLLPNMERQLQLLADNVRDDRPPRAMLTELLLAAGYPLTAPVQRVPMGSQHAYAIGDGALLICLERQIAL